MDKKDWGVHEHHCCSKHGCKYGNDDCPVVLGQVKQVYRCEDCPPSLPDTINTDRFKDLIWDGYTNWLNNNDEDKVEIVTKNGEPLVELTELQHEIVDLIKRKWEITAIFENFARNPSDYIRLQKIKHLNKSIEVSKQEVFLGTPKQEK